MSKVVPKIQKYMTTTPHTVGDEQTIVVAQKMMKDHGVRHLPVLRGGELVGVLTERDVQFIQTLNGVDPHEVKVADAMTPEPYAVSPDAQLDEVAADMAERRYGCVVIMQNNKVVGIFTTVDGMRALSELLRGRLTH